MPAKTCQQMSWAYGVWAAWAKERIKLPSADRREWEHELCEVFTTMSVSAMQFWLPKFVLKVRRAEKVPYPPDFLYAIRCGLQRSLKFDDREEVQWFKDHGVTKFRDTLDAEMKNLRSTGEHKKKKAEVIGEGEETVQWVKGLLGDHNPEALLDTLVYYIGLFLAIRGSEHRNLRFKPSQIELVEPVGSLPFLV